MLRFSFLFRSRWKRHGPASCWTAWRQAMNLQTFYQLMLVVGGPWLRTSFVLRQWETLLCLLAEAAGHGDCRYLSMDGTFWVCFSLLGQARLKHLRLWRIPFPSQGTLLWTGWFLSVVALVLCWGSTTVSEALAKTQKTWSLFRPSFLQCKLCAGPKGLGAPQHGTISLYLYHGAVK